LYDAVAQFLLAIAANRPLVLILDDLHWADHDSLRLLRHLARFTSRSRMLLVGTYRDVEVDRRHPLAETLAILRREVDCLRIPVAGFSFEETAAYLKEVAVRDSTQGFPRAFARRIHEEAHGNPFYARELFRHLVEEGAIATRDGRWSTDRNLADLGIPEGCARSSGDV
jgi:predicted ATPase